MITSDSKIRIRYGDTDQMGVAYYGNYPLFYEVGRTDMLRDLGISYKEMEARGTILPVIELKIKYLQPAFYDEEIIVKTYLKELPSVRIKFEYELFNSNNKLINKGETTLAFINKETQRPTKAPDYFLEIIGRYFKE
jgi:acyl-CoA thioester hydrolase